MDDVLFVRIKNPKKPGESLVLSKRDYDPAVHHLFDAPADESAQHSTAAANTEPAGITALNVAKACDAIADLTTLDELTAVEAEELANEKYPGGRQGVLEAIAAMRELLNAPAQ